jgi:hypothetical protein
MQYQAGLTSRHPLQCVCEAVLCSRAWQDEGLVEAVAGLIRSLVLYKYSTKMISAGRVAALQPKSRLPTRTVRVRI